MGKTNLSGHGTLSFFEWLASKEGVRAVWDEFRSGERAGDWGILAFSPESDSLHGVQGDEDGLSVFEVSFFDWLSRRVRLEVHSALVTFGDLLGWCQSAEEAVALRDQYTTEISRLKSASAKAQEEGVHQVLLLWLDRMNEDVQALASDTASRRLRRGGASDGDVDQALITETVKTLLREETYWHSLRGARSGPNVNKIFRAIQDDVKTADILGDLDPRRASDRIRRALSYIDARFGLIDPRQGAGGGDEVLWT